ncbi:peptide deformylase [Candidatus Nomurabacteria bacterium RIFCSPHIGHO2_02_FULL_33_12]|uniref:Peptide deformylase n=1 Tax=Candidatus Nomurabacteria bacterium RIFCSPLOWO2_01_FULL_33_17 TaxID=1801764 RepID=A0A1F6WP73_9BACT|nr:MAG: peptide deformylase [Candidatus Nomurabacteria bacterium RIFCSPHIGHO2_02_FULL_33_12]OGI83688.1 MAG: peptide deformylase [Candidatus Nomurabacteria bacterium RIFCSPLOWO2_01_FULL_33_17]
MKRIILQNPNKILRRISQVVRNEEFKSVDLKKILRDMNDTLEFEYDGVALAGPQIGINKRIFVVSGKVFSKPDGKNTVIKNLVCINPEIIKLSKDRKLMHEGCLSVRPIYGDIRRASRATIRAQDENGEYFEITGSGIIAEIFQHEIDHLNGILFIDNAINLKDDMPRTLEKQKKMK